MASSTDEEGIKLIHSCSSDSTYDSQLETSCQVTSKDRHWKWPFRSIGSRRLAIILAWGFIIDCSLRLTRYRLQYPHLELENNKEENSYSPWFVHWNDIAVNMTFAISCPITGLIAEVIVGRYKLISFSLKVLWLLSIAGCVLSICEYCLLKAHNTIFNIQFFLVVVPGYILKGAFLANAIPLGIDQITDGANTNICSFIVWFFWASLGCSYSIAATLAPVFYKCAQILTADISLITSLLPVLLLSIGLIIDFLFGHKLVQERVSTNPVSLIFRVLRYAAKHKFPVQRSAFTYCENKLPTRLDNGKSKYGGPFTTEQVEDVKTFWRVLVVILIISMFNFPLAPLLESTSNLEKNFASFHLQTRCIEAASSSTYTPSAFIVYSIPLYELLIYPCLQNSGPSILNSAGIGAAIAIASSVYGMMVETTRQVVSSTNSSVDCMFTHHEQTANNGVNHFLVGIPFNFLLGFTLIVFYISNLKFICAQAPYNMRGLLIGLSYMLQTIFSVLGSLLYVAWSHAWLDILHTYTCGTWFYLSILMVAAALSVLFSWLVRWYKKRERDETASTRRMVEDLYYKYDRREGNKFGLRIVQYQL